MRRSLAQFSESEASNLTPSLADFTTTTRELKFSVQTADLPSVGSASHADRDAVVSLWERAGLVASYNDPRADFDFSVAKSNSDVLVAREHGAIVASVLVGHDGHRGWLWYVSVDPDHQKRGLGALVVAAAETWLAERGVRKVMLLVRETNTAIVKFYDGLAYETVPRTVMQKWLVPSP
jgi:ribosomal protein S18 acetylase RimI-like enzyme